MAYERGDRYSHRATRFFMIKVIRVFGQHHRPISISCRSVQTVIAWSPRPSGLVDTRVSPHGRFSHQENTWTDEPSDRDYCHDDFGLATANTITAAAAGANVLSTTMNGMGERSETRPREVAVASFSSTGLTWIEV
jgi:hypothetical protein